MKKYLHHLKIGTILGVLVALYIGIYLFQTIYRNYQLQREIADMQLEINDLQNDRDSLKYKIQYYQSDAYKEKEARAKLGLQQPGEGVVILPHDDNDKTTAEQQAKQKPQPKSNWQQWLEFLKGTGG